MDTPTRPKPRRSPGETQTSISLSKAALKIGKKLAREDDRSFSQFVERLILEKAGRLRGAESWSAETGSPG